jgi:hypothetical protein
MLEAYMDAYLSARTRALPSSPVSRGPISSQDLEGRPFLGLLAPHISTYLRFLGREMT